MMDFEHTKDRKKKWLKFLIYALLSNMEREAPL